MNSKHTNQSITADEPKLASPYDECQKHMAYRTAHSIPKTAILFLLELLVGEAPQVPDIPVSVDRSNVVEPFLTLMTCPKHVHNMDKCGSLIQCPYNEEHYSDPKNFAEHLRDCRREYCSKNASSIRMVRCSHNSRHHVPQMEIEFHNQICENQYFDSIRASLARIPMPLPELDSSTEESSESEDSCSDSTEEAKQSSEQTESCKSTSSSVYSENVTGV